MSHEVVEIAGKWVHTHPNKIQPFLVIGGDGSGGNYILDVNDDGQISARLMVYNASALAWEAFTGSANLYGYRSSDGSFQPLRLDKATNTLQTIDYEHHEIHAGSHFFYTDKVTLASAGTQDYLLTTPNTTKWTHLTFAATGNAITQVDLYEGADRNGTTAQTVFNSNRNSATTATMTVHKGQSGGTTDGSLIWTMKSGSSTQQSRSGLSADRSAEIILKQGTKYLLRFTSGTNDNLTNLQLEWYEHTDVA